MAVRRERRGAVEVLTLDRPEKRNALDRATVDAIGSTVREVEADPDVRVLVLTGAGPVFCAGMDLTQVGAAPVARTKDTESFMQFLERGCRKPVVAALNGTAVAGGLELALACDLVVAVEQARLGLPEVRRGLIAAGGGTLLATRIPRAVALEIALTGETMSAERAHAVGLVNRVVGPDRLMTTALDLAEAIARNSPGAVLATKTLVDQALALPPDQAWSAVRAAADEVLHGPDALEGATAFLEGREPVWTVARA